MKTNRLSSWKTLLFALIALPLSAAKPVDAPRLQVRVETPTVFDIVQESDVTDALLAQMDTAFRRAGFEGRIAEIDRVSDMKADIPLLTVRLTNWERRVSGFVECRFTANLTSMDGSVVNLGAFNGTAMSWGRSDRFTLSRAFEDAAIDAMRTLYKEVKALDTTHADEVATR